MVKNLPAMQDTRIQFLRQEDLLEKEMATHSSILPWEIRWTEEPDGLQAMTLQRVGTTERLSIYISSCICSTIVIKILVYTHTF